MKKILIITLALIVGAVGGYFAYQKFLKNSSSNKRVVTAENYKEPFQWGITVYPSTLRKYHISMWNKQLQIVQDLGTKWIRVGYDFGAPERLTMYDAMLASAKDKGPNFLLVLEPGIDTDKINNPYDDGYKKASEVADHFKGKIKFYQVLNEIGGVTVKRDGGGYSGEHESDIDLVKYVAAKDWMRGAIDAIRKNDPDAYIVVDSFWTHYAVIDKLIRDGINFDILGWNWYSGMKLMKDRTLEDGTLLVDKLKSYNKPIMLLEVNQAPGKNGKMNEDKQAEYITEMADWAYNSGYIKGFYISGLVDSPPIADKPASYFGIMRFQKAPDGGYTFGDPKKAYTAFQELIAKYSK